MDTDTRMPSNYDEIVRKSDRKRSEEAEARKQMLKKEGQWKTKHWNSKPNADKFKYNKKSTKWKIPTKRMN